MALLGLIYRNLELQEGRVCYAHGMAHGYVIHPHCSGNPISGLIVKGPLICSFSPVS